MLWLLNAIIAFSTKRPRRRPPTPMDESSFRKILWVCDNRSKKHPEIDFGFEDIDEAMLQGAIYPFLDYIDTRYDCADFKVLAILKLFFVAPELFQKYPAIYARVKKTLLGFKFWLFSPGRDSMCYYSENHQICFVACEYLIGMLFPDETFAIDGKIGTEHMAIAKERFDAWIDLRNRFSYSEFYSSNYMPVNLSALSMIIQYSNNAEMIEQSKKQMDVLLSFYTTTLFADSFINASGRDYSRNVMNCSYSEPNSAMIIDAVFHNGGMAKMNFRSQQYLFVTFYCNSALYRLDPSILDKVNEAETISARRFGLDLKDYEKEGLANNETKSVMMRLGSGAITNPEIIDFSIQMVKEHKQLRYSDFLYWIRAFTSPLYFALGKMGHLSRKLNFYNNRMALEKADVYTYRNTRYRLSCNQGYHPGSYGAQKNTIVATLPRGVTVFTTHPLRDAFLKDHDYNSTPSYFSGYGEAPYAVADRSVALVIYNIHKKKPFAMPYKLLEFTHAFFPTELFDEYSVEGNYAFARIDGSYIALIGRNPLRLRETDPNVMKTTQGRLKDASKSFDLVQDGMDSYWIYELSSMDKESFEDFKKRVKSNPVSYANGCLEYSSDRVYKAVYDQGFYLDGNKVQIEYDYDIGGSL